MRKCQHTKIYFIWCLYIFQNKESKSILTHSKVYKVTYLMSKDRRQVQSSFTNEQPSNILEKYLSPSFTSFSHSLVSYCRYQSLNDRFEGVKSMHLVNDNLYTQKLEQIASLHPKLAVIVRRSSPSVELDRRTRIKPSRELKRREEMIILLQPSSTTLS